MFTQFKFKMKQGMLVLHLLSCTTLTDLLMLMVFNLFFVTGDQLDVTQCPLLETVPCYVHMVALCLLMIQ